MQTSKRMKILLIAVVIVGWGSIGANIYLNFFKKSTGQSTAVLDLVTERAQHLPK